jgi:hypothetical protein
MKIIITQSKEDSWNIATNENKEATELGYDEAIGTVASLIMQQELITKDILGCLNWIAFPEYHYFQKLTWNDRYKPLINAFLTHNKKGEGKVVEYADSIKITLDNLDEAFLTLHNNAIMVENEHGTKFHIDELSDNEIEIFINSL